MAADSEDLDILALAESSGEEDGVDTEVGSSDDESSEGEWVMHNQPALQPKKSASGTAAKQKEAPDKGGTKRRRRTDTKSVFAAAEDYEHLTQDNAAEAIAAEPMEKKRQKPEALAAVPKRKKKQKPKSKQLK